MSSDKGTAGTKRALCVGINDYPGTSSDLAGCVNDAKDWKAALEARGYGVSTLLDSQATKSNMVTALKSLIDGAQSGDSVVFTFSGHGSWIPDASGDEPDDRDEMLCPHDIGSGGMLLDDELATIFGRKRDGVRLYFISDSCHSGTVAKFAPSILPPEILKLQPRPRFLPPHAFLKEKSLRDAADRVAMFFGAKKQKYPALLAAGCRDIEYSYDAHFGSRPNGAFSYFALKALKGNPTSPRVWMNAIRESLPTATYPQTPSLYGSTTAKKGPMF
ncbi:MAG: caspase family protein [Planctomycetes bacterium]|nr:caspase family protein [Planctomycetota bacterium]